MNDLPCYNLVEYTHYGGVMWLLVCALQSSKSMLGPQQLHQLEELWFNRIIQFVYSVRLLLFSSFIIQFVHQLEELLFNRIIQFGYLFSIKRSNDKFFGMDDLMKKQVFYFCE